MYLLAALTKSSIVHKYAVLLHSTAQMHRSTCIDTSPFNGFESLKFVIAASVFPFTVAFCLYSDDASACAMTSLSRASPDAFGLPARLKRGVGAEATFPELRSNLSQTCDCQTLKV